MPDVQKVVNEKLLLSSADAQVWAKEFMKLVQFGVEIDEGLMMSWFANAMLTAMLTAERGSKNA